MEHPNIDREKVDFDVDEYLGQQSYQASTCTREMSEEIEIAHELQKENQALKDSVNAAELLYLRKQIKSLEKKEGDFANH